MKHYVGYSFPKTGRDRTPSLIPQRSMEELYLPPFKESIDAGAMTVMVNSGDVNGIPGHTNKYLLNDILKEKWGLQDLQFQIGKISLNYTRNIEQTLQLKTQ